MDSNCFKLNVAAVLAVILGVSLPVVTVLAKNPHARGGGGGGRSYSLQYQQDLYIVRDGNDPDIAILTTEGDPALNQPNVREADLLNNDINGNKPGHTVGTYEMPMTIIVRRVAPSQ